MIRFSDKRPEDYWGKRGYDWFAGLRNDVASAHRARMIRTTAFNTSRLNSTLPSSYVCTVQLND